MSDSSEPFSEGVDMAVIGVVWYRASSSGFNARLPLNYVLLG